MSAALARLIKLDKIRPSVEIVQTILRQNTNLSGVNLGQMNLLAQIGLKQDFDRSFVNMVVAELTPLLEADTAIARNSVRRARLSWQHSRKE